MDSLNKALNGDGNYLGFLDIINDYGITKSANLAKYYAGICYLRLGQFENAIDYLERFGSDDDIVSPMAKGAIGDAYMELKEPGKAVDYYIEAADMRGNEYTAPMFLMKAAMAYEVLKKYDKALEAYKQVKSKYPRSFDARDIDKYIAYTEALLHQ
jgi:tetratricopeptide (TPR) repeat protein